MTIEGTDEKSLKQLKYLCLLHHKYLGERRSCQIFNCCSFRNVYTKAMEQLEKGEVWLAHSMEMLGMKPWTYVGFAVFPNIANRKTLVETGLFKQEDESKVN